MSRLNTILFKWLLMGMALSLVWGLSFEASAATIVYKETITKIVDDDDLNSLGSGEQKKIYSVAVSEDGSKVAFAAYTGSNPKHFFTTDKNGSSLNDWTAAMTGAGLNQADSGYLRLDRDGSRAFFYNKGDSIYSDWFYYCDLSGSSGSCSKVCNISYDAYGYNDDGSRVFLQIGHTAYGDDNRGFWYSDIPAGPVQFLNVDSLCGGTEDCGNTNLLGILGAAADNETVMFTWEGQNPGMYKTGVGQSTARVPNEGHTYIWPGYFEKVRGVISDDGTKALYYYYDEGQPWKLDVVNPATGSKTTLAQYTSGTGPFSHIRMAGSGNYALVVGSAHKATRIHTQTLDKRDTMSYRVAEFNNFWYDRLSNFTQDGRYYYFTNTDWSTGLYRVDTAPTDFSEGPNITGINFSQPYLEHPTEGLALTQDTEITVTVAVTHPQGLGQIYRVFFECLVDGQESPEGLVGDPITIPFDRLYDDGTHGDQTPGDGIFTHNGLKVNTGSNWYDTHSLPHAFGVRIVARDSDSNYCIADTTIQVRTEGDTPALYDFNGDGRSDILYRHPGNGKVGVWLMNGTTEDTWAFIGNHGTFWDARGVGDFNGDGHADIIFRNTNGMVGVWLMNGTTEDTWLALGNHGTAWDVKGVGDFNGDGHNDVVYRNSSGTVGLWLMTGTTETTWQRLQNHGTSWDVKGVGDFNGDGSADVLYSNANGMVGVWLMNGTTEQTWVAMGNHGTYWQPECVGDYNNDGNVDVVYMNTNGMVGVWLMTGTTETTWQRIGNHGDWEVR